MKLPSKCPTCGDIMLTEFKGEYIVKKTCSRRLNHSIEVTSNQRDEILKISISLPLPGQVRYQAVWHVMSRELRIIKPDGGPTDYIGTSLPYFEPDLSNYPKLIEKIKTYLVFS